MVTTVYFIRHAEAMGNINRVFQGHTDSELSENGYKQLEYLAERCRDIKLDAIYSSPLKRTLETAKAANKYHKLPIIADERLMEINGGDFEGVEFAELPIRFAEIHDIWENTPHLFMGAGKSGESMRQVYDRMCQCVIDAVNSNKGKSILMVSHGCALRNLLCYVKYGCIESISQMGWLDNTAISCVEFDEELKPQLLFENDIKHLPQGYSTLEKQDWWKK
ncbi:MAG TPA: histidine phosphatase family protein [Ruminococcaceae bacterium]|nr:histidine phosphatase family protein [Oscillospiraceae bacterium]